ncbi:MAG TPA: hypothetical protein PKL26_06085, partial [Methanolinea sp.]|nr:hypothetical protein [Methanolinea sp.]
MQAPLNPWSSQQSDDIEKLFSMFGIEPIATIEGVLPRVPSFISRGVVVGHRDYRQIAEAIHGSAVRQHRFGV